MKLRQTFSGFLLLIVAACFGLALVFLPNWLITQYQTARSFGQVWGTIYISVVGTGLFLLTVSALWLLWKLWGRSIAKQIRHEIRNRNPSKLSAEQKAKEIDENVASVARLQSAASDPMLKDELDPLIKQMDQKREQQVLEIVAFGTISSGKSSVLNLLAGRDVFATELRGGTTVRRSEIPWPGMDKVILVDTPGLGEIDGADHIEIAATSAKDADLILLVVDGPLRQSEFQLLEQLGQMEKRVIVCLNKADWYAPRDREKLVGQISRQAANFVEHKDIVIVQAESGFRIRRVVTAGGSETEESVPVEPDIGPLAERMTHVLRKDGKDLLMANLLLQSRGMLEKARERVQMSLDRRAWQIVDRYMWGAGGAAAVLPGPFIDLVAGVGISTKMIVDIGEVYQQKVDLQTAQRWIREMGKNLIGVLGMNAATPALAATVASIIKTVPIAGTIAGGVLQGAVQALICKWIGSVFIEYFRNEMKMPEGGLASLARRRWEELTTADELRKLVMAARRHFGSNKNFEHEHKQPQKTLSD